MSVDITRAPYRQSGNVVRDSSTEAVYELKSLLLSNICNI